MRKHNQWGKNTMFLTAGGLFTYFLRGNSPRLKIFSGFLFMFWNGHIYTLGSHIGVLLNLKSTT